MPVRTADTTATLALVEQLCSELAAEDVRYCHWKSNPFLDRSRTADNDLDLLVAREDAARFSAVMHRLQFKFALRPARAIPGIVDFYGYDAPSARLVHVHAHFSLVVGDDLAKGFRLPLERAYLEAARPDGEFLVPPPELELVALVLRLILKHSTWEAFLLRRATVPPGARAELDWLSRRADAGGVDRIVDAMPGLDRSTYAACAGALAAGASPWTRMRAARRLLRALRLFSRRSRAGDVAVKVFRRVAGARFRALGRPAPRKHPASGGAVIALVGADGAGKSSVAAGLEQSFGRAFELRRAHLGRPPASAATQGVRVVIRLRAALRRATRRSRSLMPLERAVLAAALARDRARELRRVRRASMSGCLVVCDRFPLAELASMDAPRCGPIAASCPSSRLVRRLAAWERRCYASMGRPDVLVVLRVDPDVAVRRKPEEAEGFVRSRWAEVWVVDWEAAGAHVVDGGQALEQVLSDVRSLVWSGV